MNQQVLTDDECRDIYNAAMRHPLRTSVTVARALEQATLSKLRQLDMPPAERIALTQPELMALHDKLGGKPTQPTVNEVKVRAMK